MKVRYAILLVVVSFFLGGIASYIPLANDIEKTNILLESLINDINIHANSLEKLRAVDNLEITLDTIEHITSLQNRDIPRRFIGEEYSNMIEKRVKKLEAVEKDSKDTGASKKSEYLIKRAEELLVTIEMEYFD